MEAEPGSRSKLRGKSNGVMTENALFEASFVSSGLPMIFGIEETFLFEFEFTFRYE
jgi:hypothetical protein